MPGYAEVAADGVTLAGGEFIASELVVWAAGVKAPEVLRELDGLETNRINQLVVGPTLQTTRDPDIFVIGDCAACPWPGHATPVPPRAQAAHQQAAHMVGQIERRLAGRPLRSFVYRDFGSLVSLGNYSTVGNLMGFLLGRTLFVEGLVCTGDVSVVARFARAGIAWERTDVAGNSVAEPVASGGPQREAALTGAFGSRIVSVLPQLLVIG